MPSTQVPSEAPDEPLVQEPADPSFVAAIEAEYGQYVAAGPVLYFGTLAFAKGHPVPAGHPCVPMWLADGTIVQA